LALNIASEIVDERTSTNVEMKMIFKEHDGEPFENIINDLIGLLSIGALDNRSTEGRMTGEWLVYAEIGNTRYILTMANHKEANNQKETDVNIYNRIKGICFGEFPEIKG